MNTIQKITLSTVLAAAIAVGTVKVKDTVGKRFENGWTQGRMSYMEETLQIPHELVRKAEIAGGTGLGSLAPVYAARDAQGNITRICFEDADDDGQAFVRYFPDGKVEEAAFFDRKGQATYFKHDEASDGLTYICHPTNQDMLSVMND